MKSNLTYIVILQILFILICTCATDSYEEEDDLPDFDFEPSSSKGLGIKEDYIYPEDTIDGSLDVVATKDTNPQYNMEHFNFESRERKIRQVLIRALANTRLKQKFVEVMPVLRMMSKAQRLTLAALIQAQVDGNRVLTLEQVKQLFGNREDLILPLILDIANLIKLAAESHYHLQFNRHQIQENEYPPSMQILKRSFFTLPITSQGFRKTTEVNFEEPKQKSTRDEDSDEEIEATVTDITKLLVSNLKDDRMHIDDSQIEAVVKNISHVDNIHKNRSSRTPKYQKISEHESNVEKKLAQTYHERKFNMTAFNSTVDQEDQTAMASNTSPVITHFLHHPNQTMDEIEDLALASLDAATTIFPTNEENVTNFENLPQPEQLIRIIRPKQQNINFKRPIMRSRPALRKQTITAGDDTCERFSSTVCLSVRNYPVEQVMRSIQRHKHAMSALLVDYKDKSDSLLGPEEYFDSVYTNNRRQGDTEKGAMCDSIVRFARPQKARSATGEWKYIVNTGSHTQTLRLEKCSAPLDSCSYLTDNYRSRCIQVYNYHRLLSWDGTRGLHVDIFKVPTCCSCHIDGYKESFPPLAEYSSPFDQFDLDDDSSLQLAAQNHVRYTTLKDLGDLDTGDSEDNIAYQYSNGFKRKNKPLKPVQIGSSNKNVYDRPHKPSIPIIDEFLSPPISNYESNNQFKPRLPINSRRRPNLPLRKQTSDQFSAESDTRSNEVTVLPPLSVLVTQRPRTLPVNNTLNVKLQNINSGDTSRRVNYNYHPIIDFFEDDNSKNPQSPSQRQPNIDRMGNADRYNQAWRPMTTANGNINYNNNRRRWGVV